LPIGKQRPAVLLSPPPDQSKVAAPDTSIAGNNGTVGDRELEIEIRAIA
jgi:hypothetical protein